MDGTELSMLVVKAMSDNSDDRAYLDEFLMPGLIEGASDGRGMGLES